MSYYNFRRFFRRKKKEITRKVIISVLTLIILGYFLEFLLRFYRGNFVFCSFIAIISLTIYKSPDIIYYLKNRKNTFSQDQLRLILQAFTPRQFEIFAHELFKALGYSSHLMPDIILNVKDIIVHISEEKYVKNC